MSNNDDILVPWYSSDNLYEYGTGQKSKFHEEYSWEKQQKKKKEQEAKLDPKWKEPTPYQEPRRESQNGRRSIIAKQRPDFCYSANSFPVFQMAELTAATRLALQGKRAFSVRGEKMIEYCTPWFNQQKAKGLKECALVYDFIADSSVMGKEHVAIICWYADGTTGRTTFNSDERTPIINTPLSIGHVRKFLFKDNFLEFREALLDIAQVAPFDYWKNLFTSAADIVASRHCEFDKQPGTFYLPQPYFKYELAVAKAFTGGGMGGWNDIPIVGQEEYKITTAELAYQKLMALAYAVNNC